MRMMKDAPLSRPGSTFAYSNVGYAIAGLMAEQVTGRSWERLMSDLLFEPLGMASARVRPSGTPGKLDAPWGHDDKDKPSQSDNAPALGPAGTVHATIPDWAKFAALHLRGGQGKARLLKPATFRMLHTPPSGGDYAGGWMVCRPPLGRGPGPHPQRQQHHVVLHHLARSRATSASSWRPTRGATVPRRRVTRLPEN